MNSSRAARFYPVIIFWQYKKGEVSTKQHSGYLLMLLLPFRIMHASGTLIGAHVYWQRVFDSCRYMLVRFLLLIVLCAMMNRVIARTRGSGR